jgi:hypothetical protein
VLQRKIINPKSTNAKMIAKVGSKVKTASSMAFPPDRRRRCRETGRSGGKLHLSAGRKPFTGSIRFIVAIGKPEAYPRISEVARGNSLRGI